MKCSAATLGSLLLIIACSCDSGGPSEPPAPIVTRVVFTSGPKNVEVLTGMAPVLVTLQDANGATVTSAATSVTISLEPAGTTAALCCALTSTAKAGIATFPGLTVSKTGTFTLKAQSGSLTGTSVSFTVTEQVF